MNGDLKDEQTPVNKAVELMLQAQVERRHVLLLEGPSDYQLFNRFVEEAQWELEYLEGKEGLLECATVLATMGLSHFCVLSDRDPLDPVSIPGAIYTTESDLEADLLTIDRIFDAALTSRAIHRPQRRLSELNSQSWRELIDDLVSPWTSARLALSRQGHSVPMRDFPIHALGNRTTGTLSLEATAVEVSKRSRGAISDSQVLLLISSVMSSELKGIHNGHHLVSAIAWASSTLLGASKIGSERIEEMLRTAVTFPELLSLACVRELEHWAHSHNTCLWITGLCSICHDAAELTSG